MNRLNPESVPLRSSVDRQSASRSGRPLCEVTQQAESPGVADRLAKYFRFSDLLWLFTASDGV
jgi:hypothetical protein